MDKLSFAEYQRVRAVNWSSLKELRKSPLHYKHAIEHPREDSVRFALGRAAHTAILEPLRFLRDYVLWEGGRRAGKEWEAFKVKHPNKTILKPEEHELACAIAESVKAHPVAGKLLSTGAAEQTLTWTDAGTGLKCKGRVDWIHPEYTVDIKTAKSIEPRQFAASCARLGYHGQAAFYAGGRALSRGEEVKPFVIVAVENDPPHDVMVYELDADAIYAGEKEAMELLATLKRCLDTDTWPGRSSEMESLAMPAWLFGDEEELTARELGEEEYANG